MTDTTEHHRIREWITFDGHAATCICGWRTTRRTSRQRDRDADRHEIEHGLEPLAGYLDAWPSDR